MPEQGIYLPEQTFYASIAYFDQTATLWACKRVVFQQDLFIFLFARSVPEISYG
ncbi:MAG: hypothetical protein H0V70_30330 [Ktedonobacteraceae bacterium]|jgi:hypothetical protein|nr:hypothetical protein [Ktedonobacteraceae bacterium]